VIRVVIDTNVYVAALLSRDGAPARIIRALGDGLFDTVSCPALLAELEGVLVRPKISSRISSRDARDYVEWLKRVAIVEPDPEGVPPASADPDDDLVLALARESRAKAVVSGDEHLLDLERAEVRVLSPAAFAEFIEALR